MSVHPDYAAQKYRLENHQLLHAEENVWSHGFEMMLQNIVRRVALWCQSIMHPLSHAVSRKAVQSNTAFFKRAELNADFSVEKHDAN